MTRSTLLALLALPLAAVPASAQTTTPEPAEMSVAVTDSVAADTAVTVIAPDADRARALYREGLEFYRADNNDDALLKYEESLLYGEGFAPSALGLAQVLTRLGRLEDARNAYEQAVAMSQTFEAANAGDIRKAARRGLEQITEALDARVAAAATAQENQVAAAAAQATTDKVKRATEMLSGNEIVEAQAIDAYALLEQARLAGYDPNLVAFYYAKALNTMGRGADAVPYAEKAVEDSADQADRSAYYIQLGLAHTGAGDKEAARAAFQSITEGQAWHGWAQHYIGELDSEGSEG